MCQLRPPRFSRLSRRTRGRATALAVSREEAQHASELRMRRAVLRWLWSVHTLGKGTEPARGPSPSACGHGATCQLLPTRDRISWHSRGTRERATALAVSQEEAQHARLLRVCAVPR